MAWEERAKFYEDSIKGIRIMPTMEGQDIRDVVSGIDEVLNEAFFDLSAVQAEYESLNAALITRTSELFLEGKDTKEEGGRGSGMSDEKAKAYSRVKASQEGYIEAKLFAEKKLNFMENVIKLLSEKKFLLNTSYGTIKLESDIA